jgi:ABC-type amino acid transport substrate-binding protein
MTGEREMRYRSWFALLFAGALALSACTSETTEDGDEAEDTGTEEDAGEGEDAEDGAAAPAPEDGPAVTVDDPSYDRVAEIQQRGSLIVGMTLQFEPQMYRDDNNEPAGYDVELVTRLAEDLGVELDIRDQEFDALIPGMLAGQFDMISVGLVNRPPRAELMWFTRPYVPYRQVVVVNEESGISSVEDINEDDKRVTALIGSTAANQVETQFPDAELVELDQAAAFLEVASGRADAIVVEEYLALPFVNENAGVSVLDGPPLSQEYGRWAVPRGDLLWQQYVDNWLDYYTSTGFLDQLYSEIIGPTEGLPQ